MSDFLCLRFKSADISPLSKVVWTVLGADGKIQASGYALLEDIPSTVPEPKGARRNIVIVPSSSVLLTNATVPTKQHRHLKQVLGFVVEDQIIEPIENVHLATPAYHASETIHVAAVNRELLEDWLEALESIELLPDYMFVDVLCVPPKAGEWQLLFEEHKALFRNAQHSGIALDKFTAESILRLSIANLDELLDEQSTSEEKPGLAIDYSVVVESDGELDDSHGDAVVAGDKPHGIHEIALLTGKADDTQALAELSADIAGRVAAKQQPEDDEIKVEYGDLSDDSADTNVDAELDPDLQITPAEFKKTLGNFIRSENIQTSDIDFSETVSELLAVNAVQHVETTLNLLQGEFSPISANAENRRFIRRASLSVAACLAVFLFVSLAGGYYLNYRADSYFDESVAIYREVFPKQRKVPDPVKLMQRQLSGNAIGGTTSDFLPLLDAASRSLSTLETEVPSIITQLRYDTQRGHIIIDLRAQSIDVLEAYKRQMSDEGLKVDILSANQDQEMTNGRIQVGRT